MLCESCRYSGRVGFVRASASTEDPVDEQLIPCPHCGGSGIAHCCDGICEQPSAPDERAAGKVP
jgi:hypothetical protein